MTTGTRGTNAGGAVLEGLGKLLAELRRVDSEMTIAVAQCFLVVALHPGIAVRELANHVDIDGSTASRIAGMLGRYGRGLKDGYRLIEFSDDAADRRVRRLNLSEKGQRVLAGVVRHLSPVLKGPDQE